ncbi:SBBP repeat-containing protein [Chloroflexota bacterium]
MKTKRICSLSALIFVLLAVSMAIPPLAIAQVAPQISRGLAFSNSPVASIVPSEKPVQPDASTEAGVEATLMNLPLHFIENQGQMDEHVAYYVLGSDKTIYFTAEGVTFVLSGSVEGTESWQRYALKLSFVGADADVQPVGEDQTGAVISYFKGSPEEWKTGLPTYGSVVYPELWPGIDLVYGGDASRLKYMFFVKPGIDPSQITLAYSGASSVTLNEAGQLEVKTPVGGFNDERPFAYQEVGGQRVPVEASYALDEESHSYGFEVGVFDPSKPLVIDPAVLVYCGYIGGSGGDVCHGVAVDGSGCAYVTGYTYSDEGSFPVAVGPDPTHNGGSSDAFVAKVKADGSGLVYCGYIGGSGDDFGQGIAVDSSDCAYVTGYTYSDEGSFPVAVGPGLTYNGSNYDTFVAKIKADGSGLVYCGYIGGSGNGQGYGIAVDGSGCAYVTGNTYSDEGSFPVTVGPDLTINGNYDAFVAKVKADGSGLVYCGYIGGSGNDYGHGINVDGSGFAYINGYTNSGDGSFPVAVGPDLTHNGGTWDAFVAKVKADGSGLVYCGYIGGSGYEVGRGIALDSSGYAYVNGSTNSGEGSFPVTVGPDLTYNSGTWDAFVAKVKADGSGLVYCGYIGGSGGDEGWGIAVDGSGCAYVNGETYSSEASFPVAVGPDLTYNGGNVDAFVAKIKADGSGLVYCGYIGGSGYEVGRGIAVDVSGRAYASGYTTSSESSFPVTVGPDLTLNGNYDAFVAKLGIIIVGGSIIPVNKFELLAPWIVLAVLMAVAMGIMILMTRHVA